MTGARNLTGAEITRRYRARHPERNEDNTRRVKARARAKTRLAKMYPRLMRRLYEEECARDGVEPNADYDDAGLRGGGGRGQGGSLPKDDGLPADLHADVLRGDTDDD